MRAESIKYYRGKPQHQTLLDIAKQVTYSDWWLEVFPNSDVLVKILIGRVRPNCNRDIWKIEKETPREEVIK